MNLTVKWTKRMVNKALTELSPARAFSEFRHKGTDYETKYKIAYRLDKGDPDGPAYTALVELVVEAALSLSANKAWVKAVEEWSGSKLER